MGARIARVTHIIYNLLRHLNCRAWLVNLLLYIVADEDCIYFWQPRLLCCDESSESNLASQRRHSRHYSLVSWNCWIFLVWGFWCQSSCLTMYGCMWLMLALRRLLQEATQVKSNEFSLIIVFSASWPIVRM